MCRARCLLLLAAATMALAGGAASSPGRRMAQEDDLVQAAIVNGFNAEKHRFPYMVSLRQNSGLNLHFCGGALVHKYFILTAAHCFVDDLGNRADATYTRPIVRIGGYTKYGPDPGHEARRGVSLLVHPRFDPESLENDVALVMLDRPSAKHTIRLPAASGRLPAVSFNQMLAVLGWGSLSDGGSSPKVLQEASLKLQSFAACKKFMPEERWGANSMLCAGNPSRRKDTCDGDSGGPLLKKTGKGALGWDVHVGIVSWGYRCAGPRPGVYTNTARVAGWIRATMTAALRQRRLAQLRRGLLQEGGGGA